MEGKKQPRWKCCVWVSCNMHLKAFLFRDAIHRRRKRTLIQIATVSDASLQTDHCCKRNQQKRVFYCTPKEVRDYSQDQTVRERDGQRNSNLKDVFTVYFAAALRSSPQHKKTTCYFPHSFTSRFPPVTSCLGFYWLLLAHSSSSPVWYD